MAEDDAEDARELIDDVSRRALDAAPRRTGPTTSRRSSSGSATASRTATCWCAPLTHRSRAHEDAAGDGDVVGDNESLEFLGDAVLGLVVADVLFRQFPLEDEGRKSKMKAALVSEASLATIAERLGLGEHLRLGRGEDRSGGRRKAAVIADACEAVIAAIYLDGGLDAARTFVERELAAGARRRARARAVHGDDRRLQVGAAGAAAGGQRAAARVPARRAPRGPTTARCSRSRCGRRGSCWRRAEGLSKKEAEQRAAKAALERLTVVGAGPRRARGRQPRTARRRA